MLNGVVMSCMVNSKCVEPKVKAVINTVVECSFAGTAAKGFFKRSYILCSKMRIIKLLNGDSLYCFITERVVQTNCMVKDDAQRLNCMEEPEWKPFVSRVVLTAFHMSSSRKPFTPAACKMLFCTRSLLLVQNVRVS